MAYMAVGSRQILHSDTYAPAVSGQNSREVAVMEDNSSNDTSERIRTEANRPVDNPSAPPQPGDRVDVHA